MIYSPRQLANHLKLLRTKDSITQAQLAERVGLKQATLSNFENNPDATQLKTVFKIIQALGVTMNIGSNESRKPSLHDDDTW